MYLVWYLIIKSLDQKNEDHVKIFDTLLFVCRSSRYACLKIAEETKKEYLAYLSKQQYIWWEALDAWGGFYNGQWRITDYKPGQEEIDSCCNSGHVHMASINDLLALKYGSLCDNECKDCSKTGYSLFSK